jgi:hypothetical protein
MNETPELLIRAWTRRAHAISHEDGALRPHIGRSAKGHVRLHCKRNSLFGDPDSHRFKLTDQLDS